MNIAYKVDIERAHEQLAALTIVEINQKIGISDNKFYVDNSFHYLQPIIRFLTNQNRYSIYIFLEDILSNYINNIVAFKRCNFVTGFEIESRKLLTKDIHNFLQNAKLGFLNLKQTYPDYKEMHKLIDNFNAKIIKHYFEP